MIETSQRRLQRAPDFTGNQLNHFHEVALRHGLLGAFLGTLCLLHPGMRGFLVDAMMPMTTDATRYVSISFFIFFALCTYAWYIDRKFGAEKLSWVVYLLAVSIWEEWVFRLAVPYLLDEQGVNFGIAIVGTNLVFGLMHYFTLRWKWQWCLGAFIGGMALSRQLYFHSDFALIIALHWIATFLNTPRMPGQSRKKSA